MNKHQHPADRLIGHVDRALRVLNGVSRAERPNPAQSKPESELTEQQRIESGRLMRVNHCGEICAQALYLGQGLTSRDRRVKESMEHAAQEEIDHLAWCEDRLKELDTHTSYLNPAFYALSFTGGAISGLLGNRINLGFVAATEEQVVQHLEEHLERLPEEDHRSREILSQMKRDEDQHRTTALEHGGTDFPKPIKSLMTTLSKVMTRTTYWV